MIRLRVWFAEIRPDYDENFWYWHEDFETLRAATDAITAYERLDGAYAIKTKTCVTLLYFIERLDSK